MEGWQGVIGGKGTDGRLGGKNGRVMMYAKIGHRNDTHGEKLRFNVNMKYHVIVTPLLPRLDIHIGGACICAHIAHVYPYGHSFTAPVSRSFLSWT